MNGSQTILSLKSSGAGLPKKKFQIRKNIPGAGGTNHPGRSELQKPVTEKEISFNATVIASFSQTQCYGAQMKRTFLPALKILVTLTLISLALCAIPAAGAEEDTVFLETGNENDLDPGGEESRWNATLFVRNVSSDYPTPCSRSRAFAAATAPGDVFYLTYYDFTRHGLVLARSEKGKDTGEIVVKSARACGVSLAINPITGKPAVSYRLMNSTPIFSYKKNGRWIQEFVDYEISEGDSTSLVFDQAGTPHIAYDHGSSFSNLMYATRNPNGIWTTEIADHGIGYHLGDAGKNPQLRITDTGVYIAHGDGFIHTSLRFTWRPAGGNWTSVTVDRGWGETGTRSIAGITGGFPTFTLGPDGVATIMYTDALNKTLMRARGPLANNSFKTSVFPGANGTEMNGWFPVLVNNDSSGRNTGSGHLVFVNHGNQAVTYAEIGPDPAILPTFEEVGFNATTCTVTSDSAGKPHIFYLDEMLSQIRHVWRA
jgi:hypothetical protein